MKTPSKLINLFLILNLIMATGQANATIGIQRTINSTSGAFNAYLKKSNSESFSQAYFELSQKMEVSSAFTEVCLEKLFLGKPNEEDCLLALKEITQRPLNPAGREILFSFLTKIEKQPGSKKEFFHNLKLGLLETDPELALIEHQTVKKKGNHISKSFASLEIKVWKKALAKVIQIEESQLLINGKLVNNLKKWNPPLGVYQWSLLTDTHEPLIRLGTFLQFAAESVKNLVPFAQNCKTLSDLEIKKFGLLQVEVFASDKCIAKEDTVKIPESQHLTQLPKGPAMSSASRHWIWPTLILVGVGLVIGTRGKNIHINSPSFR